MRARICAAWRVPVETVKSGMDLMVFPEGGRSQTGQIRPFLSGAFYVAIKAGVPVIPMAIGGRTRFADEYVSHSAGEAGLVIGKPIPTAGILRGRWTSSASVYRKK